MKGIFGTLFAVVLMVSLGLVTAVPVLADASPGWTNITRVAAGQEYTVGLKSDGTVVAVGHNDFGQCDVGGWVNITQVAAGAAHTVGLKSDGTVVAVGYDYYGQCDVGDWTGINQTAAGWGHTLGLRSDGTVVAVGYNGTVVEIGGRSYTSGGGQLDVGSWMNITRVAAGWGHTVGLRSDGTVVAAGGNPSGQCNVTGWTGITQVSAGAGHTVGLKSDGTVVAVGDNYYGQCNVGSWSGIVQISAGWWYTVGLKSDGTVVAVGDNYYGQRNVGSWTNITQVAAGWRHTAGRRNDSTVIAAGSMVMETVHDGTVNAKAGADTEVAVNGTAMVTVFQYPSNPGGDLPTSFSPLGTYVDVYVPDTSAVTEIEIRVYYTDAELVEANITEESLRLFWLDGGVWKAYSRTGVNNATSNGYSGYVWAKIGATDVDPSLADLQGLKNAPGGLHGEHDIDTGFCFIATAVYGTDTARQLDILREFRDTVLLPNNLGAKFVSFYYRTSPSIANFISQHEVLRTVVRVGFIDPIVKMLTWNHALWVARGP
jgi:alpha-tubulin suppressor-like RCC1 family protein